MIVISEGELKIITDIISEYAPDCDVFAFGSRCNGTPKKYSDLDLAFAGESKLELKKCFRLEDAFAESDLPYRVDVLDYNSVSPEFRKIIDEGNEVIFRKQVVTHG